MLETQNWLGGIRGCVFIIVHTHHVNLYQFQSSEILSETQENLNYCFQRKMFIGWVRINNNITDWQAV